MPTYNFPFYCFTAVIFNSVFKGTFNLLGFAHRSTFAVSLITSLWYLDNCYLSNKILIFSSIPLNEDLYFFWVLWYKKYTSNISNWVRTLYLHSLATYFLYRVLIFFKYWFHYVHYVFKYPVLPSGIWIIIQKINLSDWLTDLWTQELKCLKF